jgi:hypothetical protein
MVYIYGVTPGDIKEIGYPTNCMGEVYTNGRREGNMKGSTNQIRNMVSAVIHGRMVVSI